MMDGITLLQAAETLGTIAVLAAMLTMFVKGTLLSKNTHEDVINAYKQQTDILRTGISAKMDAMVTSNGDLKDTISEQVSESRLDRANRKIYDEKMLKTLDSLDKEIRKMNGG